MHLINQKRVCPYSNEEFMAKRSNQKFASKEFRIAFHNEINNSLRRKLSNINKQLIKNYKILKDLTSENNETIVHKEFLKGKGFAFTVFTSVKENNQNYIFGIYDFGFYKSDGVNYKIIKQ